MLRILRKPHEKRMGLLCGIGLALVLLAPACAEAGPLYVYTDAQGQAVMTDDLQQVPPAFRGRVRTVAGQEVAVPATAAPSAQVAAPSSGMVEDLLAVIAKKFAAKPIKGLTPHQSAVVVVAGCAAVMLIVLMFLSNNPAVRVLGKLMLVVVALMAMYQMYFRTMPAPSATPGSVASAEPAQGNFMGQAKAKTEQSYRLQDSRTTGQLEQAEPSNQ